MCKVFHAHIDPFEAAPRAVAIINRARNIHLHGEEPLIGVASHPHLEDFARKP
jgi:hypothetical protein